MIAILATPNSWILYHKIKKNCAMLLDLKNMKKKRKEKDCKSKRNIYIIDIERNQMIEHKLRKELEEYEEVKSMRVRQINVGEKGIRN